MRCRPFIVCALLLAAGVSTPAIAQDDLAALREQVRAQQAQIAAQQTQLEKQAEQLRQLDESLRKLGAVANVADAQGAPADGKVQGWSQTDAAIAAAAEVAPADVRDSVGDLNSAAVVAGDFPGSFKIAGDRNLSLAIGGLIKGVAIYDSDAETMGSDFLPALLNTTRSDSKGAFALDATLSRLFVDGRAPVGNSSVRGYVEWDFNGQNNGSMDFKLRHAFGSWNAGGGTLLVGHTWSTLMDLAILPEGLTEPTVSGAIFNRQALIRWSQPLGDGSTLHLALEDPSSSDVLDYSSNRELSNPKLPDAVVRFEYAPSSIWHVSVGGIARDLRVELPSGEIDNKLAWGMTLTGHVMIGTRDKWVVGLVYGKGVGRYLLGIQSSAGAAIDPSTDQLDVRKNWGALTAHQHHWSDVLRTNLMVGYASAKPLAWQADGTFRRSAYAAGNLMWAALPYLTIGIEYAYGIRYNLGSSDVDNHRLVLGFQFF